MRSDDGVMTSNDDSFVYEHLASADNEKRCWDNQVVRQSREWSELSAGGVSIRADGAAR
ncbi:MAG: hypothetical protein U5J63_06960 [Fodinibius sp.]|nr:hypothetical protein [Fodinibius sp.]